jgi:hypothetical protein
MAIMSIGRVRQRHYIYFNYIIYTYVYAEVGGAAHTQVSMNPYFFDNTLCFRALPKRSDHKRAAVESMLEKLLRPIRRDEAS